MGLFEQFPYTNFHELNLDWMLSEIRKQDAIIAEIYEYVKEGLEDALRELLEEAFIDAFYDPITETLVLQLEEE